MLNVTGMRHWPVAMWDRLYRRWHGLDHPRSRVPPLLSVSVARAWRSHRLPDGTMLERGAFYGELHLDNAHVVTLSRATRSPVQRALRFRVEVYASLTALAELTEDRFAALQAFSAVTIFHRPLRRLGFEIEPAGLVAPRVAGAYQHALLLALAAHPAPHRPFRAQRLWISRRRLRSLYGVVPRAS